MFDPDVKTSFIDNDPDCKTQTANSSNSKVNIQQLAMQTFNKQRATQQKIAVVVDGNNIAYSILDNGKPRTANIVDCLAKLAAIAEIDIIACFVSAKLRHVIDEPDTLEELMKEGLVIQTPSNIEDDFFILETADEFDAIIISNDRYKQHKSKYPNIKRVPFIIVRGRVIFAGDLSNFN